LDSARTAASEALAIARMLNDPTEEKNSYVFLGWIADLAGDTPTGEQSYINADQIEYADDSDGDHLYSRRGVWWGENLARTGRSGLAQRLIDRNRQICMSEGWNQNVAQCDRVLAQLDLAAGHSETGLARALHAVGVFRDGEYLLELADALAVLADATRACGNLDLALRHANEALDRAGPRGQVITQTAALTARARVYAARVVTVAADSADRAVDVARARDDTDAALGIAVRYGLGWHELDALEVHATLDRLELTDRGWSWRAATLRTRLIPAWLDPDPLTSVERQVAAAQTRSDEGRRA
jgi:hypothetical protein